MVRRKESPKSLSFMMGRGQSASSSLLALPQRNLSFQPNQQQQQQQQLLIHKQKSTSFMMNSTSSFATHTSTKSKQQHQQQQHYQHRNNFIKVICFIVYSLGLVSLVLILLMAQRLESGNNNNRSFRVLLDFGDDASKKQRRSPIMSVPGLLSQKIVVLDIPSTPTQQERMEGLQKTINDIPPVANSITTMNVAAKKEMKQLEDAVKKEAENEYQSLYGDTKLHKDGRLIDPRLADSTSINEFAVVDSISRGKNNKVAATGDSMYAETDPVVRVMYNHNKKSSNNQQQQPANLDTTDENVLVVIISNRRDGIIPTIASILRTSTKPVDVVLIGVHSINEQVNEHFGKRINDFTSLSVQDIEDDLVRQGFQPIWTWPDWHTSMDPSWPNENTLHVGSWDNLDTHAHELNHIRFYLPHVSVFNGKRYFYFMDDDLLIHKDLGVLAEKTMNELPAKHGLVCACNIWMWNSECFHFEFQTKKDYILSMPSLYGDRDVCKTDSESHCVPPNYWDFVNSFMPEDGKDQFAWNFGFSLFALQNWRDLKLTEKYEHVMKESYRLHVFPETSLTFGLGVSYIAFAGNVECWNEDHVKVRDGFGFIEWDRYAATFGDNFYDDVAVAHYTGPDKPWVNESRIELRAINPWLKMMEEENMTIPIQLPLEPTNNLFTLLGSDRSGAQWILSVLDKHPQVCASGEADKPETGFPADVLLPEGLPWYPYCSIKRGCTYEFVSNMVAELTSKVTEEKVPLRCLTGYDAVASNDVIADHLPRLCSFIKKLNGNFHGDNVAKLWVEAFVTENKEMLGCGCVRGVKAKGLKVMAEWILPKGFPYDNIAPPFINLSNTKVHGSKIIRLKRKNAWARYKSMLMAQQTGVYHPISPGDKNNQIATVKDIEIEVHHMEWHMKRMIAIDKAGDEWAKEHASTVLWLDYDDCRADTVECFSQIYKFIGVDTSHIVKKAETYESSFATFANTDSTMDFVANKGIISELIGTHGWDHYVADSQYTPIQFLVYEESDLVVDSRQYLGINTTHYGQHIADSKNKNRYAAVLPILKNMKPSTLVVLSSDRDGRVSFPVGDHDVSFQYLYRFRQKFEELTKDYPGSIVAATESDCCVTALTHASPGDFFGADSSRTSRACLSGQPDCQWNGDDKAKPWQVFMQELSKKRSTASSNVYLDTSLLVGRAGDMAKLISTLNIQKNEDDRAVLTAFLYRNPNSIVLDYEQQLIGENRKKPKDLSTKQCFADSASVTTARYLDTLPAERQPLFMYSPRDLGCGDNEKKLAPTYPMWDSNGIVLKPILDHVDRVVQKTVSIVLPKAYGNKPDYRQGPEVPYFIDDKGVWSSDLIRERTDNETFSWRMIPTEGLVKAAQEILMREDESSGRWDRLKVTVRSGGFPYWAWYGDFKTCNYQNYGKDSIPLFTTCAMADCTHAFPMPNYMTIIDTQVSDDNWRGVFRQFDQNHPWESKVRKVGWRGALSEAEWTQATTSARWRVSKLVHELNSDLFDVGLTGIPSWLTEKVNFDLSQIGGFKGGISPMSDFQQFMAVLDMDGNSWSSRFGSLLCYNSVVIKIEPKYIDYFYSELAPWTHFIPVKNDLSDLQENVAWALDPQNEIAVKNIISAANHWCSNRILPNELATDLLDIFESYVRLLDRADPDWGKEWQNSKESLLSSSDLKIVQL